MAIPSVGQLETPLLEELADGAERSTRELAERLALRFDLSAGERAERRSDGRPLFYDRVQRARTALKKRGLVVYPRRSYSRITPAGLAALTPDPIAEPVTLPAPYIGPGPLESELRALTGPAVDELADWQAIRLLSGWSAQGIYSFAEVAERTGRTVPDLIALEKRCNRGDVGEAPILDAVIAFACAHPWVDPDEYSFHLAQLGLSWSPFSIAGVCEAARRFGRQPQWRTLIRQLATLRGKGAPDDGRRLPRPFESWFEVEVFLFLEDLGYQPRPQISVGEHEAGIAVDELRSPCIIECDGAPWSRGDRAARDGAGEHELVAAGYTLVRIAYSDWRQRTAGTQTSLRAKLRDLGPLRSVG